MHFSLGEVNGNGDKGDIFTSIEEMCLALANKVLLFGISENLEVLLKVVAVSIMVLSHLGHESMRFFPLNCNLGAVTFTEKNYSSIPLQTSLLCHSHKCY